MLIVGLTGSIGMGKSTTAAMFRDIGALIWDADAAVHALYDIGGAAVGPLKEIFPSAIVDGAVNRDVLSSLVLGNTDAIRALEKIVHPLVGLNRQSFIEAGRDAQAPLVILDIPLLFENGGNKAMDQVIVVTAPAVLQRERVLARPGMTVEKFEAILARQVPDSVKREGADFIVDTGQGLDAARKQVKVIYTELLAIAEQKSKAEAKAQ
jgi:dephospho-CoA kinase